MPKRFAPYCERNQQPILEQLSHYFKDSNCILEIGSGTGQHAVFFAKHLPHLTWHTSDVLENHDSVKAWIAESGLENVQPPVELMIGRDHWPDIEVDGVFTANTTHIMQPHEAQHMMQLVAKYLPTNGRFCQYGPMIVNGDYTSESNREFDRSLKAQGFGGMCSIEQLALWGEGLKLVEAVPMPANNFLLVWQAE